MFGQTPEAGVQTLERIHDGIITTPSLTNRIIEALKLKPEQLKSESTFWPEASIHGQMER
jgi:hypothetical protein